MRLINVHSFDTRGWGGLCCLGLSYLPCGLALSLIFGIIIPFYTHFVFGVLVARSELQLAWYAGGVGAVVFLLLLTAYFRAVFTSPGYVDRNMWEYPPKVVAHGATLEDAAERRYRASALANADDDEGTIQVVTQPTPQGQPRYCSRCAVYKPDGSHHCSDCNRCVLKMDHHCPWINNCVGRDNEKFFFLFISYVPVCATHICSSIALSYRTMSAHKHTMDLEMTHLVTVLVAMCAGMIGLVLGCFAIFHAHLIVTNQRTIDRRIAILTNKLPTHREQWVRRVLCCRLPGWSSSLSAFRAVLGDDVRTWWLPVAPRRRSRLVSSI